MPSPASALAVVAASGHGAVRRGHRARVRSVHQGRRRGAGPPTAGGTSGRMAARAPSGRAAISVLDDAESNHRSWNEAIRGWIKRARRGVGVGANVTPDKTTYTAYFFEPYYQPYGQSWGAPFAPTQSCRQERRGRRATAEPTEPLARAHARGVASPAVARALDRRRRQVTPTPTAKPTPKPTPTPTAKPTKPTPAPTATARSRRPRRRRPHAPTPEPTPTPTPRRPRSTVRPDRGGTARRPPAAPPNGLATSLERDDRGAVAALTLLAGSPF